MSRLKCFLKQLKDYTKVSGSSAATTFGAMLRFLQCSTFRWTIFHALALIVYVLNLGNNSCLYYIYEAFLFVILILLDLPGS